MYYRGGCFDTDTLTYSTTHKINNAIHQCSHIINLTVYVRQLNMLVEYAWITDNYTEWLIIMDLDSGLLLNCRITTT